MEEQKQQIERQTAHIVSIREVKNGTYHKQEGFDPNYVITTKNQRVTRVNIMGVLVTTPQDANSISIDDGTDKIEIRVFDNPTAFNTLEIGDIVLIIGKPREYNKSIYITAEIIKKMKNKGWLEYRKKQLALHNILNPEQEKIIRSTEPELIIEKENQKEEPSEIELLLDLIKKHDGGKGCPIDELIALNPKAEEIIQMLLLKGEVYEVSAGKIKVL